MNLEIPELKQEISKMNDDISLKHEEKRYIKNDTIELEETVAGLKEEIKKINKSSTDLRVI